MRLLSVVLPLLLCLAMPRAAGAQDPMPEPAVEPEPASPPPEVQAGPRERLDEAVRLYQLGQREEARALLSALVVEESEAIDVALRQEARVFLGELLYTEGDEETAEVFFRQVLGEDPEYILDPFRHPPDVTGFFNFVKAQVAQDRPDPIVTQPVLPVIPARDPLPWSAFAPLGIYHLGHGRPVRGYTHLTLQATTFGYSFITFWMLQADHTAPIGSDEYARLSLLRSTNRVTAVLTGILWGVSILDASLHWGRSSGRPAVTLQVGPTVLGKDSPIR